MVTPGTPPPHEHGPEPRPGAEPGRSAIQQALPVYYALLFAILTAGALYLLVQLRHVLVVLFISLIFAAAIARPAAWLERFGIPRVLAALLVYLVAVGAFTAIGWLVIPTLVKQVGGLGQQLPDYVERYNGLRERYDGLREEYPGLPGFDEQASGLGSTFTGRVAGFVTRLPTTVFGIFLDLLSVFAISMLVITSRGRLLAFILSVTHPDHRQTTRRVLEQMWLRLGHYLRAKLMVMAIIAAITYGTLLLIGVPFALLLAIVVGLGQAVPRVGPWLARIPLLGIAALEGWRTLGLTFLASVIIENAKGYAISPFVEGDQLDIHPLLVFVSVLVGGALLGFAGAFIAVPAAALVQVLFEELIIPWRRAQIGEPEGAAVTLGTGGHG